MYYFNHTDPHLLDDLTEDTLEQIFLSIAIIILWLIIAISVPAALYSEIPISTAQSNQRGGLLASTVVERGTRKALDIIRKYYPYTFEAVLTIAPFLDITLIVLNVWLMKNCEVTWFILCIDAVFILFSIFEVVGISVLAWHNRDELDKWWTCVLYAAGVFSLVVALQLLTFHGTFILLVFISSPIPTVCFTLIYISALFSILSAVSIMIKVIHRCCEGKVRDKKCHYAFQITGAILLVFCVLSFDALFFITLMRARLDNFGISGFFGALVPTAIIALVSFVGNKLIEENHMESNNENSSTGDRDRPTDQTNIGHFRYLQSSNKKSNTGEIDEEERVIENPWAQTA